MSNTYLIPQVIIEYLEKSRSEKKGIKLLRIKESEWNNNRKHVESEIRIFLTVN